MGITEYVLRTLVAKLYQQNKVEALKICGMICDIIHTSPIVGEIKKTELTNAITKTYFDMWENSHGKKGYGYDE